MTGERLPARIPVWHLLLAFALSLLVLCSLIGWLHNVHILTQNGMYKSIQAESWIADPANARLDPSNYLYFPLYGAMARALDALDILRGVPWKQFAYLNAFWASLAVAFVYGFIHRLTGNSRVAVGAACFHLGCGFFLLLAVINEDIMPGYTLVLGAMVLAALWFDRPTNTRAARVSSVSSGPTGIAAWAMIGPPSSSGVTKCTVQPWIRTPAASARRCVCRPGNAGSRAGWILRSLPA